VPVGSDDLLSLVGLDLPTHSPLARRAVRATRGPRRFAGRWVGGVVSVLLLTLAAVTVLQLVDALQAARNRLAAAAPLLSRTLIQDRLVGMPMPATIFQNALGAAETDAAKSTAHLFWIVDLDRCDGCLPAGIVGWNALRGDPTLIRNLVVAGDTAGLGRSTRALAGTNITVAGTDPISSAFGFLLPSTQLLVDRDGIIVMADSRTAVLDCGWNFAAQVGSLRGTLTSDLIRN